MSNRQAKQVRRQHRKKKLAVVLDELIPIPGFPGAVMNRVMAQAIADTANTPDEFYDVVPD
jgi:hypothetical protein